MVKLGDYIFVIFGSISLCCLCCLFMDKFVIRPFRIRFNSIAIGPQIEETKYEQPNIANIEEETKCEELNNEETRICNFV